MVRRGSSPVPRAALRGKLLAAGSVAVALLFAGCAADDDADIGSTPPGTAATSSAEWQTVARLRLDGAPEEFALQPSPSGGGVVSWDEYDREPATTASVAVHPDGSLGTVTRKPLDVDAPRTSGAIGAPTRTPGSSASAAGKDGRGIVAFAESGGDGGGLSEEGQHIRAWPTTTRNGQTTYGAPIVLGPNKGLTDLSAAVLPSGDTAVLWGTQDPGEEANEPWRVRLATIRAGKVLATQLLDRGGVDRPTGAPRLAATPQGRLVAVWSSVVKYDKRPLVAAVSDTSGLFNGTVQRLDASGYGDALAVLPDGSVLATWSSGDVRSAVLRPGATHFEKDPKTGPDSESYAAPGFTGRGEPLLVADDDGELVVRVRR